MFFPYRTQVDSQLWDVYLSERSYSSFVHGLSNVYGAAEGMCGNCAASLWRKSPREFSAKFQNVINQRADMGRIWPGQTVLKKMEKEKLVKGTGLGDTYGSPLDKES
jgi:hypothetical protein